LSDASGEKAPFFTPSHTHCMPFFSFQNFLFSSKGTAKIRPNFIPASSHYLFFKIISLLSIQSHFGPENQEFIIQLLVDYFFKKSCLVF